MASRQEYISAPYEGMDVSVPAHMLPETRSPFMRNFLCDGDRVRLRGPLRFLTFASGFVDTAGAAMAEEGIMFPYWAGQDVLTRAVGRDGLPGSSSTERWWPWDQLERPGPATKTTQPPAYGRMQFWNPDTGFTAHAASGTVEHAFGPHIANFNDNIYAVTTGAYAGNYFQYPSASGRFHPQTLIVRLAKNPAGAVTAPFNAGREAPRSAQGLASYAGRLWALGGVAATTTADTVVSQEITNGALQPSTLWYTHALPTTDPMSLSAWMTNNTIYNRIVVGAEGPSDYGVGLTAASKYMVVHKKRSTWVLTGYGIDSFAVRQISATSGLVDPRARLAHEDVVYWVSRDGLMSYDGAEVSNLSRAINPILRPAIDVRSGAAKESGSFVILSSLGNDYLLLQMGRNKLYSSGTEAEDQSWLYHIPSGRWTLFYTDNYSSSSPVGTVRSGTTHYHATSRHIYDATFVTDPLLTTAANRGNDLNSASNLQSYPAECHFVPLRFAAPMFRAQIERYGFETIQEFGASGGVGDLQSRLVRYLRAASGGQEASPVSELAALAEVTGRVLNTGETPEYLPSLNIRDLFAETTDVQMRINRDYTSGVASDPVVWMEVVGAFLEWFPTHERAQ